MKDLIAKNFFVDRLQLFGEAIALKFDSGLSLNYRELADRVDAFAKKIGTERCLILLESTLSIESIIAYLAALKHRNPVILTATDQKNASEEIAKIFKHIPHLDKVDNDVRAIGAVII